MTRLHAPRRPVDREAVTVRPATSADVGPVVRLLRDQTTGDGAGDVDGLAQRVARLIQEPSGRLLIVTGGRSVLGAVALTARTTLLGAASEAWVEVLATARDEPDCVGELLLEAAERAAVDLGCSRLVAECSVARTSAHRLLEADGWVDVHPVSRRLGRPAQPAPGLINRFVAACAVAATDVSAAVATEAPRVDPADLHRTVGSLATAALEPLGVPIDLGEAAPEERRSVEDWWIPLRPLDGLCNATRGRGPHAFAAALVRRGEPVAGVVVELTSGRRWIGVAGAGMTLDGRPHGAGRPSSAAPERGVCAAPRRRLGASGALAVELCDLAEAPAERLAEVSLPRVALHELAAPMVILSEAGVVVSDAGGTPPILRADVPVLTDLRLSPSDRRTTA